MILKPQQSIQKKKFPAGSILLEEGKPVKHFILLHEGEITVANTRLNRSQNRQIYKLVKNSIPGFASLLRGSASQSSYIAQGDIKITAFPAGGNFQQLILGKTNFGFTALRSMLNEISMSYQMISCLNNLFVQTYKFCDNLSLTYRCCVPSLFKNSDKKEKGEASMDVNLSRMQELVATFERNGGKYPTSINQDWFQSDYSNLLETNYQFRSYFNMEGFQFFRRMLSLPTNIQSSIYKADLLIMEGMAYQLRDILMQNIKEIYLLQEKVDIGLEKLFDGEHSYTKKIASLCTNTNEAPLKLADNEFSLVARFFYQNVQQILKQYKLLQNIHWDIPVDSLKEIMTFITPTKSSHQKTQASASYSSGGTSVGSNVSALREKLKDSPKQICKLTGVDPKDTKLLLDSLKALEKLPSPIDANPDARKLRRGIETVYWKAWTQGYKIYRAQGIEKTPLPLRLMLSYGFFDETMLDDNHLSFLYQQKADKSQVNYPIYSNLEWLDIISSRKESPSLDELGLTYFEKLKSEDKAAGWKRESDVPAEVDTNEKRIEHEITNMLISNVRLTSGAPMASLPFLNRYQLFLSMEKSLLTKKFVSNKIDELLNVDFSAFYREVIFNSEELGISKEFIQEEVIPNFIIVPSTGSKFMMWQDLAGRSKSSRGRILLPCFNTADFSASLRQTIATFRWELIKSVMGADWNNVGLPSLTADYTDYVQFYKKNRDLSPEIKKKLKNEFKRFRSDRDRFANDYSHWVQSESQGVLKLNKVVRSIFYKHVPFHKTIRDKISKQPAFDELHNRFKNIQNRKHQQLIARYRKFSDALPEVLKRNLDFYEV